MKKICVLTILLHLVVGCMFAINYPTYNPDRVDRSGAVVYRTSTVGMTCRAASEAAVYSQMAAPSAYRPVESSASAVGFGAISAVPTIGPNGCATAPHRASMGGDDDDDDDDDNGGFIPTPTTPQTPDNQVPVGDCLFPLLFAALLFAIGKKFSKKSAESTKFCCFFCIFQFFFVPLHSILFRTILAQYPHNVRTIPTQYPHNVHTMPAQYPHNIRTILGSTSVSLQSVPILCYYCVNFIINVYLGFCQIFKTLYL